jgi:hypothetical protein
MLGRVLALRDHNPPSRLQRNRARRTVHPSTAQHDPQSARAETIRTRRQQRIQRQLRNQPGAPPNRAFQPGFIGTSNLVGNFEGKLGTSDGGCVDNPFLWCDNLDNNNFDVMTLMTRDFATMVLQMAFDTKVMSASNNAVISKKAALAGETGSRHLVAG